MIPKIIVQTSRTPPDENVVAMLKHFAPSYEYRHFTDQACIDFFISHPITGFENIVQKFVDMPSGAHRADLFRYYFIYLNGGIFIDSDAMICVPMDDIVGDASFFSVSSCAYPDVIFQGFIGATARHPILYAALLDAYHIDTGRLRMCYELLCANLMTIVRDFIRQKENLDEKIVLYREEFLDAGSVKTVDDKGRTLLIHYWNSHTVPLDHMERCVVLNA